jgi:hypothetical protein
MENPGTWGLAEHVVNKALNDHDRLMRADEYFCGLSVVRKITDALRAEGLLNNENYEGVITIKRVKEFSDASDNAKEEQADSETT